MKQIKSIKMQLPITFARIVLSIFFLVVGSAAPAFAGWQKDAVCGGGCGGGCGPCGEEREEREHYRTVEDPSAEDVAAEQANEANENGREADKDGRYAEAEQYFRKALSLAPGDEMYTQNLANSIGWQADAAYKATDYAQAENLYRQALALTPDDQNVKRGIAISLQMQGAKVWNNYDFQTALGFYQQAAQYDPDDEAIRQDLGVLQEAVQKINDEIARQAAADTKASEQLISAAAVAKAGGDLTVNYDIGGAPHAGSISLPKSRALDPSTFTEAERNDPRMVAELEKFSELQNKHSDLDNEIERTTVARNNEKDPAAMSGLTNQLDQLNHSAQENLLAITEEEKVITKTKKLIDTEVEKKPNQGGQF